MTISDLKLVRELDQPATEVLLVYNHPSQPLFVAISRTDLSDVAKQPLLPSDQNFLVETSLETLEPVIEGKRARGETTMRTDPRTGRPSAFIELTRGDLEQGITLLPPQPDAATPVPWGWQSTASDMPPRAPRSRAGAIQQPDQYAAARVATELGINPSVAPPNDQGAAADPSPRPSGLEGAAAKAEAGTFASNVAVGLEGAEAKATAGEFVAAPPVILPLSARLRAGSSGGAGLMVTPSAPAEARDEVDAAFVPPTVSVNAADRSEVIRRLDAIEANLQKLAPLVEAVAGPQSEPAQIGHNRPPEHIDAPPLSPADIAMGTAAVNLARSNSTPNSPGLMY